MKTDLLRADHPVAIKHAVDVLHHGGVIAFPTDTVYGLAALAFNEASIESLYVVKGRNNTRAIAVLIGDMADLAKIVSGINPKAEKLAHKYWPGPLTLVVPGNPALPRNLSPTANIGIRMPDHPIALELLRQAGPLAVTSANLSGAENATTAQEVLHQLGGKIHLILDGGPTPGGVPSTVVDCSEPELKIIREGPIDSVQLLIFLNEAGKAL
jgi:L-threonylcarbamoyladenylate synthase